MAAGGPSTVGGHKGSSASASLKHIEPALCQIATNSIETRPDGRTRVLQRRGSAVAIRLNVSVYSAICTVVWSRVRDGDSSIGSTTLGVLLLLVPLDDTTFHGWLDGKMQNTRCGLMAISRMSKSQVAAATAAKATMHPDWALENRDQDERSSKDGQPTSGHGNDGTNPVGAWENRKNSKFRPFPYVSAGCCCIVGETPAEHRSLIDCCLRKACSHPHSCIHLSTPPSLFYQPFSFMGGPHG